MDSFRSIELHLRVEYLYSRHNFILGWTEVWREGKEEELTES